MNQAVYENYISWIQIVLDELSFNRTNKSKLVMLVFLLFDIEHSALKLFQFY